MLKRILSFLLSILMVLLFVASVPVSSSAAAKARIIPDDAVVYNGHYYKVYSGVCASWTAAEIYCEVLGGHLATITSPQENAAVYDYVCSLGYDTAYFGYTDNEKEGTWKWVNGEKSSYSNWASGEPNNVGRNENYAEFYWQYPDGRWNDGNFCNGTQSDSDTFICEWDDDYGVALPNDWRDGYSFENPETNTELMYYVCFFGENRGTFLYNKNECENGNLYPHGHCYGMALSAMSAVCRATPAPSAYDSDYRYVYDIKKGKRCSTDYSVMDYIKYGQIFQFFPEIAKMKWDCQYLMKQDLTPLVEAVREYTVKCSTPVSDPENPVMISVSGYYPDENGENQLRAHALWGIGIREDTDALTEIMVYDCNSPGKLRSLYLYKNAGKYISWDYQIFENDSIHWGSNYVGSNIAYSLPLDLFLQKTGFQPAILASTGAASYESNYDTLLSFDENNVTVTNTAGEVIRPSDDDRILPITPATGSTGSGENTVFWADLDGDISFSASSQAQSVSLCSDGGYVDFTIPADSSTKLNLNDKDMDTISMDLAKNSDFSLNFHVINDGDGEEPSEDVIYIEGEGSDNVTIRRTEDGVIVEGVDNLSICVNDDSFDFASKYYLDSDHKAKVSIENKEIASVDEDSDGDDVFETHVRGKYLWGDANIDGEVSAVDATFLQRVSAFMDVENSFRAPIFGDVNIDDSINIMDVTLIQYYLAKIKNPYQIGSRYYVNERN